MPGTAGEALSRAFFENLTFLIFFTIFSQLLNMFSSDFELSAQYYTRGCSQIAQT